MRNLLIFWFVEYLPCVEVSVHDWHMKSKFILVHDEVCAAFDVFSSSHMSASCTAVTVTLHLVAMEAQRGWQQPDRT